MSRRAVLLALGLTISGVLAIGFLWLFDRVVTVRWGPPDAAVYANDWIAAERLVAALGGGARTLERLAELDGPEAPAPRSTLVVIGAERGGLSAREVAPLVEFIARGGHALIEVEPYWEDDGDALLDALGVVRRSIAEDYDWSDVEIPVGFPEGDLDGDEAFETVIESDARNVFLIANEAYAPGLIALRPDDDAKAHFVWLPGNGIALLPPEADSDAPIPDDKATRRLVRVAHGEGVATVVSSLDFTRNMQLGRNDNAGFFASMLPGDAPAATVLFARQTRDDLFAWLYRNALPVLLALAALIAFALWHAMPRFGPIAPAPQPIRRALLEHLNASGRFLLKNQRADVLASATADAALAAVARRHPVFAALDREGKSQFLRTRLGLDAAHAEALLAPSRVDSAEGLTALTAIASALHLALDPHPLPAKDPTR